MTEPLLTRPPILESVFHQLADPALIKRTPDRHGGFIDVQSRSKSDHNVLLTHLARYVLPPKGNRRESWQARTVSMEKLDLYGIGSFEARVGPRDIEAVNQDGVWVLHVTSDHEDKYDLDDEIASKMAPFIASCEQTYELITANLPPDVEVIRPEKFNQASMGPHKNLHGSWLIRFDQKLIENKE